jgi:hypothetical protein
MLDRADLLHLLTDEEVNETIDYYRPREEDFFRPVRERLPDDWQIKRNGVWFYCYHASGDSAASPAQGWKIHVSTNVINAVEILEAIVPLLAAERTSFKFALDREIASLMNSKSWARQGAGKFITVYPSNEEQFKSLIERLHLATKEFAGPYILSDKRYKESRVIYYRYGGMTLNSVLDIKGEQIPVLVSPDGVSVPDRRLPYFAPPDWTRDPFGDETQEEEEPVLKDGRYLIESVLVFSNSGGVYLARDTETGLRVTIKEARPFVTTTEDAVEMLKKEYRLLAKLEAENIAPKPLDFFQDWEHFFLVEEYLDGVALAAHTASHNVTFMTRPSVEDRRDYYRDFSRIFIQLAKIIDVLHRHRIVFADLSPSNIIVNPETLELKIIDFEAAHEIGVDQPARLYTPGFASADQRAGAPPGFENDYYSLGAVMYHFLSPVNSLLQIKPQAKYEFIAAVGDDLWLPKSVREIICALMDDEAAKRPTPAQVIEVLKQNGDIIEPEPAADSRAQVDYEEVVEGVCDYLLASADYGRTDRLVPADAKVFATNPLSLAHGACGVAHALHRMKGGVPSEVLDWILSRNVSQERYTPGLYFGLSGIAWVLLELGAKEQAEQLMKSTYGHPLLYESVDLFYGLSGWGMANLRFFLETHDELYLDRAKGAGLRILEMSRETEGSCYWEYQGEISFGLAHGASGVSLFLLFLYLATKDEVYLDAGRKGLDFEIGHGVDCPGGGISWVSRQGKDRIVLPYWKYGSAGVGMSLLRYNKLVPEKRYETILDRIFLDTDRKYAVFPGKFMGLAGIGDFILDMYRFTGCQTYLESAHKIARGLMLFKLEKGSGVAFPGDRLLRISCDYGTGSAGVGLFLQRLRTNGESDFMLDTLFDCSAQPMAHMSLSTRPAGC